MPTFNGTRNVDSFVAPTNEDWTIFGLGGADILSGAGGNDLIYGGVGNDVLSGGAGDDSFFVGLNEGIDAIAGGTGYDRVVALANSVVIGLGAFSGIEEISSGGFSNVTINLGAGAQTVDFTNITLTGIASINGGTGNDTITGSAGDDVINGGGGNDALFGGAGNDIFAVGLVGGYNRYDGGTGTNVIKAIVENATIGIVSFVNVSEITANGFGNIHIVGQPTSDLLDFTNVILTGIASIDGGSGDDTIIGSKGDDIITGGAGNDRIYGGDGSDTIDGGIGGNYLDGGKGDDFFLVSSKSQATAAVDQYRGGAGYDTIVGNIDDAVILLTTGSISGIEEINSGGFGNVTIGGTQGADTIDLRSITLSDGDIAAINGNDGNDTIYGSKIADTINGGNGDDHLAGGLGDDIIDGGIGDDHIDGQSGADYITGGLGNDTIVASGGDTLFGDDGNDTFLAFGNNGINSFDGGTGFNTLAAAAKNVNIGIGSITNVQLITSAGFENVSIIGSANSDVLDFTNIQLVGIKSIIAGGGDDIITGSAGADTLIGGAGIDTLNGGAGLDVLTGGLGADILTGGNGNDVFRDSIKSLTGDRITDFGVGDVIDITNLKTPGATTFAYDNNTHLLSIDPDGAGKVKAFTITLDGIFDATHFVAVGDGTGGTAISYIG